MNIEDVIVVLRANKEQQESISEIHYTDICSSYREREKLGEVM